MCLVNIETFETYLKTSTEATADDDREVDNLEDGKLNYDSTLSVTNTGIVF